MINSIDVNLIRTLCDKANMSTKVDEDGDVAMCLHADADFGHDVFIFFGAQDNWLSMRGMSNFLVEQNKVGEVLVKLNDFNLKKRWGKAYLAENGRIVLERQELIDENVSEEFLLENCIKFFPPVVWNFFKENFANY